MMREEEGLGYWSGMTVGVLCGAGALWLSNWYGVVFLLLAMLIFELHGRWSGEKS